MTPETIPIRLKATCTEVKVDVDSPKIMTLPLWKTCWAFWTRNGAFVPGDRPFDHLLAMVCVLTKLTTSSQLQASKKTFVCATKSSGYWNSAPTRVRMQNKLGVRNVLRKREGVDCRHHNVVIAVRHQRRLLDRLQIGIPFPSRLPPFHRSLLLRLHCLRRRRWISILALMAPCPKRLSGGLTCCRR